jgi:uncharacterized membrane protein
VNRSDAAVTAASVVQSRRIKSIDLIRGAVMVLMAIDHVRVYAGVPAGGPVPSVFFTRWITHFCAPAFVLLAGTSAFFYGSRHADLSRFLLIRGAWLVVLELTLIRFAWTFNFDFTQLMAGVIWVLGWCMILMAALVKLPLPIVGTIGVAIIAGHNLMDARMGELIPTLGNTALAALWKILYVSFYAGPIPLGAGGENGAQLVVLYSIFPWIGVMAAGYAFGKILTLEPARRDRICLAIGLGATALFVLLRGFNLYGDPRPWSAPPPGATGADDTGGPPPMRALLAFLNATKYPASFAFLLMTLGPPIALIPLLERARGGLVDWLTVFGRVPFFFYVLHIPLIHALALVISQVRHGEVTPWLFANHPMGNPPAPEGYAWSLPLLYFVWGVAVVLLYFACRWFAAVKATRTDWWLRYV